MNKLKNKRTVRKLTQKQLANISKIDIRSIQKYETGERDLKNASAITVYALANALNTTVEYLITD